MRVPRVTFPPLFRRTPTTNALPITKPYQGVPVDTVSYMPERGGDRASAPASLLGIGGDSGPKQMRTAVDIGDSLNLGPSPDMIDPGRRALNAGAIGPDSLGWPYDDNGAFMPHQTIDRKPANVTPYTKTIDTGVTIPSIGIGAPVG